MFRLPKADGGYGISKGGGVSTIRLRRARKVPFNLIRRFLLRFASQSLRIGSLLVIPVGFSIVPWLAFTPPSVVGCRNHRIRRFRAGVNL